MKIKKFVLILFLVGGSLYFAGCSSLKDVLKTQDTDSPSSGVGAQGPAGADGATWLSGTSAPSNLQGKNGDFYLNTSNGDIYMKNNNAWGSSILTIKGASGTNGATWLNGNSNPATQGQNGDYYLNLSTGDVFQKSNGSWGTSIVRLKGQDGVNGANGTNGQNGATWLSGTSVPSDSVGNIGDHYLKTDSGAVYQKTESGWGNSILTLKGTDGATGANGTNGTNGANGTNGTNGLNGATWLSGSADPVSGQGVDGDHYLKTSNGQVYKKISGSWNSVINLTGAQGIQGVAGPKLTGNLFGFVSLFDVTGNAQADNSGVTVTLRSSAQFVAASVVATTNATTDTNGRFQFTNIQTGTYTLKFTKAGYGDMYIYNFHFVGDGDIPLSNLVNVSRVGLSALPNFQMAATDSFSYDSLNFQFLGTTDVTITNQRRCVRVFVGFNSAVDKDNYLYTFAMLIYQRGTSAGISFTSNVNPYQVPLPRGVPLFAVAYSSPFETGNDSNLDFSGAYYVYNNQAPTVPSSYFNPATGLKKFESLGSVKSSVTSFTLSEIIPL